jgi:asparagine synthase (glutamine-hydrolysing)
VLFASKISSILSTGLVSKSLDLAGIDYYFSFGHIPTHETLFKGVRRLPAATIAHLETGKFRLDRYWQVEPRPNPEADLDDWAKHFHDELDRILLQYLDRSQDPFGVFLSGIDSAVISAMLLKLTGKRFDAFTVAFEDERYNQPFARETAEFLGLDYHEVLMTADDVPKLLSQLILAYDDLLSDEQGSLPTFMLGS